ncbi:hypothetical protein GCM10023222_55370 [Saccharopolyspora cebuensis]
MRGPQARAEEFDRCRQPPFGLLASEQEPLYRRVQSGEVPEIGVMEGIGQPSNIEDVSYRGWR